LMTLTWSNCVVMMSQCGGGKRVKKQPDVLRDRAVLINTNKLYKCD
jgi:hypothetical protein